mmetsp:Transcript_57360/g.166557  ORF Transcript_57360/g.166557 Transcript_57360/m.166557 type:complete len:331 (+) Transcript_57360:259-1251(+)
MRTTTRRRSPCAPVVSRQQAWASQWQAQRRCLRFGGRSAAGRAILSPGGKSPAAPTALPTPELPAGPQWAGRRGRRRCSRRRHSGERRRRCPGHRPTTWPSSSTAWLVAAPGGIHLRAELLAQYQPAAEAAIAEAVGLTGFPQTLRNPPSRRTRDRALSACLPAACLRGWTQRHERRPPRRRPDGQCRRRLPGRGPRRRRRRIHRGSPPRRTSGASGASLQPPAAVVAALAFLSPWAPGACARRPCRASRRKPPRRPRRLRPRGAERRPCRALRRRLLTRLKCQTPLLRPCGRRRSARGTGQEPGGPTARTRLAAAKASCLDTPEPSVAT